MQAYMYFYGGVLLNIKLISKQKKIKRNNIDSKIDEFFT